MKTTLHQLLGAALLLLVTLGAAHVASAQGDRIVYYGPVTETFGKGRSATTETYNQILSMNADGTDVRQLTSAQENSYHPTWSPDGNNILFHRGGGTAAAGGALYIMDANGENLFRVVDADRNGADWAPDGTAICYQKTPQLVSEGPPGLWAVSVNPYAKGKNSKVGTPALLTEGVGIWGPAWSPDGTRIAFQRASRLVVLDLTTGVETTLESDGGAILPSWSPSGDRIAYSGRSDDPSARHGQLKIIDADLTNITQVTYFADAYVAWPTWSPDGAEIAFRADVVDPETGAHDFSLQKVNLATGELTWLLDGGDHPEWTP